RSPVPRAASGSRRSSSNEEQQGEQREEAVRQINRDPTLLNQSDDARRELGRVRDRQKDPGPERITDAHEIARRCVERRRQVSLDAEEGLEYLPDRLSKAFCRVLHSRRLQR